MATFAELDMTPEEAAEAAKDISESMSKVKDSINQGIDYLVNVIDTMYTDTFYGIRASISIAGDIVVVTGEGPFEEADLTNLTEELGAIQHTSGVQWSEIKLIIIGRTRFDSKWLKNFVTAGHKPQFFSQEDFLNWIIFDSFEQYVRNDERIKSHPGLSYLASIGFKWPNVDSDAISDHNEIHVEDWAEISELKSKYHYNVQRYTPRNERRLALTRAVVGLGLQRVAEHIAGRIRLAQSRSDNRMNDAVMCWREDLDWLKQEYYQKAKYKFYWPNP